MPSHRLPAVDAYIAKAQPFAQPVLHHLRETIHKGAPDVEEQIKWSRPFFLYKGVILGNISAFKEHCAFGLWGSEMAATLRADGVNSSAGMGTFGRITKLEDLPPAGELENYVRKAAALIGEGTRTKSIQRVAKPSRGEVEIPPALLEALQRNQTASTRFTAMSPTCRREYAEWIADAKREDTRTKRLQTALEWIAEGKSRNWKYERPA